MALQASDTALQAAENADAAAGDAQIAAGEASTAAQNANAIADEIRAQRDAGEFQGERGPIGPQGPKGDQGDDGIGTVLELDPGLFGMHVDEDGHLILTHNDNEPAPPLSIQNGRLIYTIS